MEAGRKYEGKGYFSTPLKSRRIEEYSQTLRVYVCTYVRALKGERSSENLRETGDDFSMSKEKASKKMREKRRGDVGETLSTT